MKRFIAFFTIIMLICTMYCSANYIYDSDKVNIFITVTDITDVTNPINIVVPRTEITVSNFDITQYSSEYDGITLIDDGVTCLHAIMKLHEQLYGKTNVKDKFKIDSTGTARIFMGKSVASVVYKNAKDIFAHPQLVKLHNGDELNICLYNEGYSQSVASFDKDYTYAEPGEAVSLNLFEHFGFPRDNYPISNQEIINDNGVYVTDEQGNILKSDDDGNLQISLSDIGEHKISIMPKIDYFLSENGGNIVVTWEEETVEHTINHTSGKNPKITYNNDTTNCLYTDKSYQTIVSYDDMFINDTDFSNAIISGTGNIANYSSEPWTETYFTTELVRHETFVPGETSQMIHYTVPWTIINVTNELIFADVSINQYNNIKVRIKNASNYPNCKLVCAVYNHDENILQMKDVKITDLQPYYMFTFPVDTDFDSFKIMVLNNDISTPICTAYNSELTQAQSLDWDYTQPLPTNTIVSGR